MKTILFLAIISLTSCTVSYNPDGTISSSLDGEQAVKVINSYTK